MFSVRKTTPMHGNTNLIVLLYILCFTSIAVFYLGRNYLVIFMSSSLLHIIIETGLTISGLRTGTNYLFGIKLSKFAEILLRAFVEGPAFSVPAFYFSDQLTHGNAFFGVSSSVLIVAVPTLFLAYTDYRNIKKTTNPQDIIMSRRAMTQPKAVMALALINTISISMLFYLPSSFRPHAFSYVLGYSLFVLIFYFIHYNFGVRYIELYDPNKKSFLKPGPLMQAAGLAYDSIYEMALFLSIAYWIPLYLGLFKQ